MKKNSFGELGRNLALTLLSYYRMTVVIASLLAWSEREWVGLAMCLLVFGLTTHYINAVIDYPTDDTIRMLIGILETLGVEADEEV